MATDTWQALPNKVNELSGYQSTINITVAANSIGETTTGNAVVNGVFSAQTLVAIGSIQGGTVASPANLVFSSNVIYGSNSFALVGNSTVANLGINTGSPDASLSVNGTANIAGNVHLGGVTSFNTLQSNGFFTTLTVANTNLGTNTTSPIVVWSFANTVYNSGKIFAQITNNNNIQFLEISLAQANLVAELTVFGTVYAPNVGFVLGTFTSNLATGTINLLFQQTFANSSIKLAMQMLT